jgi:hypothetical protein
MLYLTIAVLIRMTTVYYGTLLSSSLLVKDQPKPFTLMDIMHKVHAQQVTVVFQQQNTAIEQTLRTSVGNLQPFVAALDENPPTYRGGSGDS